MNKIAITTGDPAGVGPEITSKAIRFLKLKKDVIIIIYGKVESCKAGNRIKKIEKVSEAVSPKYIYWIEINNNKIEIGKPSVLSGKVAYEILCRCTEDLNSGKLSAVVTAPVSKAAIRLSYQSFIGHTEFFAEKSNSKNVVMSFWGPYFNLALLSTHLAISDICNHLKTTDLAAKFRVIYDQTIKMIPDARIAMLGVNPHAGENNAFGNEDELIKSVLKELKNENIQIDGPFPADTFFSSKVTSYDMVISAYHDQGLIPFKMISAEEGVNVTLGLPFIRTSVDHGTAYDIAGKGIASEKSLEQAIKLAEKMLLGNRVETSGNYGIFAEYYDGYMHHVSYEKWTNFILEQYNRANNKSPEKILELACGTANVASLLVKRGLNVDASDLSPEMLKIASAKPFSPNLCLNSMIDEIPMNNYDLILTLFDSLNYLKDLNEVKTLLKNVQKSLLEKGLFIFDITTPKNCENNFNNFINFDQINEDKFIHESDFDTAKNTITSKLTFFRKKGFLYSKYEETHHQTIFEVEDIIELIDKSTLQLLGIYHINSKENLIDHDPRILEANFTRLFFVLRA
ncbi:MAG: 4-hydroxythreonine-4-phosphate dehydrogenase PdxA [Candidatus Cloacimonetes bacterium]|nr:4-hydroxythreonine-4-phosphate dehydrogenase PdxA [Candidatus Cloacimonadota bacterium]